MGEVEQAIKPADTDADERRKLVHYFPGLAMGDPAPWTSLCGKAVEDHASKRRPQPGENIPRCVVCADLHGRRR